MKPAPVLRVTISVAVIGLISACATSRFGQDPSPDADADVSQPAATRPAFETAPPSSPETSVESPDGVSAEVWAAILDVLEARIDGGVDASAVRLVSVEEVTWTDGSLGCPEPGMLYTQALVDGTRVVVELAGDEYDFRVPHNGGPRLCESEPPSGG